MDRKLRLDLDVLSVDSFATEVPEKQLRGTVEARAADALAGVTLTTCGGTYCQTRNTCTTNLC